MKDWKTPRIKDLFKVLSHLKGEKEVAQFMRDLATINELQAMSERWEVARLVHVGISYREISKKTGASTATVTRVAHWLNNGEGGYKKVLKSLDKRKKM